MTRKTCFRCRLALLLFVVLSHTVATNAAPAGGEVFIVVLGVAQDGGYPQAGCFVPHCQPGWQDPERRRLVSSIAVVDTSAKKHYLFDATPDLPEQLYRLHVLAADEPYALGGVFLTHAHMGHYTGLMHFGREAMGSDRIPVYAMPRMSRFLADNGPWEQLVQLGNIRLEQLADGKPADLGERLTVTPLVVPHRDEYSETVGYRIDGPNRSAVYIPDIDKWERWETDIRDLVQSVDYALIDATFFDDGELPGRDMSKIPHPFVAETMRLFEGLSAEIRSRIIFIHMNHSNPLLDPASREHAVVTERGFRVASEGLRLDL